MLSDLAGSVIAEFLLAECSSRLEIDIASPGLSSLYVCIAQSTSSDWIQLLSRCCRDIQAKSWMEAGLALRAAGAARQPSSD